MLQLFPPIGYSGFFIFLVSLVVFLFLWLVYYLATRITYLTYYRIKYDNVPPHRTQVIVNVIIICLALVSAAFYLKWQIGKVEVKRSYMADHPTETQKRKSKARIVSMNVFTDDNIYSLILDDDGKRIKTNVSRSLFYRMLVGDTATIFYSKRTNKFVAEENDKHWKITKVAFSRKKPQSKFFFKEKKNMAIEKSIDVLFIKFFIDKAIIDGDYQSVYFLQVRGEKGDVFPVQVNYKKYAEFAKGDKIRVIYTRDNGSEGWEIKTKLIQKSSDGYER